MRSADNTIEISEIIIIGGSNKNDSQSDMNISPFLLLMKTYLGTNMLSPSFIRTLIAISTAPEHPDAIMTSLPLI